jgi:hypothetical protein
VIVIGDVGGMGVRCIGWLEDRFSSGGTEFSRKCRV